MVIMVQEMLQKHSIFVYISIYMCFTEVIFNSFIHLPQVSQKILLQFDHLNPIIYQAPQGWDSRSFPKASRSAFENPGSAGQKNSSFRTKLWGGKIS